MSIYLQVVEKQKNCNDQEHLQYEQNHCALELECKLIVVTYNKKKPVLLKTRLSNT